MDVRKVRIYSKKLFNLLTAPLTVTLAAFLFFQLQIFNLSVNMADEGFFLNSVQRINLGQIPYRDFFMQVTPGNYYVLAFFLKIFGNYIVIDRILNIVAVCLLLVLLSKIFNFGRKWNYFYLLFIVALQVSAAGFFSYNFAFTIAILALYIFKKAILTNNLKLILLSGFVSGLAFIFKQNIGIFTIPSLGFIGLLLFRKNKLKFVLAYIFSAALPVILMYGYFWLNHALSQAIYYMIFFAGQFKSAQLPFILHRLIFIPVFLVFGLILLRLKRRNQILLLLIVVCLSSSYLLLQPGRIGRLHDYLLDPTFYLETVVFILPLAVIINYFRLKKKQPEDSDGLISALFLLNAFFIVASQGYNFSLIVTADIFLLPLLIIILKKFPIRRLVLIGLVFIVTLPYFYNPFAAYALALGKYPLNTFTQSLTASSAKYLRFNPQQKTELTVIVNFIQAHSKKDQPVLCFPYCPMLYVLSDRQAATYYGIFGLTRDEKDIIKQLDREKPPVVILIRQGSYILTPSLNINNFNLIYQYVKKEYVHSFSTVNFEVYLRK